MNRLTQNQLQEIADKLNPLIADTEYKGGTVTHTGDGAYVIEVPLFGGAYAYFGDVDGKLCAETHAVDGELRGNTILSLNLENTTPEVAAKQMACFLSLYLNV